MQKRQNSVQYRTYAKTQGRLQFVRSPVVDLGIPDAQQ
jgi:hypothetical protein